MRRTTPVILLFLTLLYIPLYANMDRDLIGAITKGNLTEVQKLVGKGANVNYRYNQGKTPLHWAALYGDLNILVYLIGKGANVNGRDDNYDTPLHLCGVKNNLDIAKYLIYKGADMDSTDRYGWTPLHYYVYYNNVLFVKYLVFIGANLTNKSTWTYMGMPSGSSPMDIALKKSYSNITSVLTNPGYYQKLTQMPVLGLSATVSTGWTNILIAPDSGSVNISIYNTGGGPALSTLLTVDITSNSNGLQAGNVPPFDLGSGQTDNITVPITASRSISGGLSILSINASETNFDRKAGPLTLQLRTLPPQPPLLFLDSSLVSQLTDYISPDVKASLSVHITNEGIGYSSQTIFRIETNSGCDSIIFSGPRPFQIKPLGSADTQIDLKSIDGMKDGTAEMKLIAEDQLMNTAATDSVSIITRHLKKPLLTAFPFVKWDITNFEVLSFATNMTGSNEIESITTNAAPEALTNFSMMAIISNTGEAGSGNLTASMNIRNQAPPGLKIPSAFTFNIPAIETNSGIVMQLPKAPYQEGLSNLSWYIKAATTNNRLILDTNINYSFESDIINSK